MSGASPKLKKTPFGFELWDNESGNLIGAYATEEEALVDINETICAYGTDYATSVALLRVGPRGGLKRVSTGSDLVERARKAAAETGARRVLLERSQR